MVGGGSKFCSIGEIFDSRRLRSPMEGTTP